MWMLLAGASLAKILAMQKHTTQMELFPQTELMGQEVVYGGNTTELLHTQNQNLRLLKTLKPLQKKGSTLSYKAFPTSGIMQSGILYQPLNLVRQLSVKEFGLWLTPTATDGSKRASFSAKSLAKRYDTHPNGNLAEQYAKLTAKRLCPNTVEYLMGIPRDYTMLKELPQQVML